MRSWKIGASLLVASFGLRAFFVFKFGADLQEIWTYHFGGTSFGFFMLGHLVCLAASHLRYLRQPALGVSLTVYSFAVMTYGGSYASCDTLRFWGSVLLFTAALPGLFEATKNIRWMKSRRRSLASHLPGPHDYLAPARSVAHQQNTAAQFNGAGTSGPRLHRSIRRRDDPCSLRGPQAAGGPNGLGDEDRAAGQEVCDRPSQFLGER